MKRDLYLATLLSAAWISICFLIFGAGYTTLPRLIGHANFFRFERLLGVLHVNAHAEMPWVSFLAFGVSMIAACVPINYYWFSRARRRGRDIGQL